MKPATPAAADLRAAFPDPKGLSASNLNYLRYFAREWPDRWIGQQSADQLRWFGIGGDMAAPAARAGERAAKSGTAWT
jgi:hypothetical protein